MPTKKKNVKKKLKKPVVDKKFLLKLANDIYNPKDKTFLRLCDGTLQNGPDPTNPKRPMHCGNGETTDAYGNRKEKVCTVATFRNRSKRVANELRAAARLL